MPTANRLRGRHGYWTYVAIFVGGALLSGLSRELLRPQAAVAQMPNPMVQRIDANRIGRETNRLLAQLLGVLRSETFKVRIIDSDKPRDDTTSTSKPLS